MRAIGASAVPEWRKEFDQLPAELREALRRLTVVKPGSVDRTLFPAGTRFISQAAIAAAFTQPLGDDWRAFRSR